jgi:hypothetical protein
MQWNVQSCTAYTTYYWRLAGIYFSIGLSKRQYSSAWYRRVVSRVRMCVRMYVCHRIQAARVTRPQTSANSNWDSEDATTLSQSRLIPWFTQTIVCPTPSSPTKPRTQRHKQAVSYTKQFYTKCGAAVQWTELSSVLDKRRKKPKMF